jgi:hypothetical protein
MHKREAAAQLVMHDARNDQLSRPLNFLSSACFWQPAHFSFSFAHSAFALFHCSDVHLETSSTLEDMDDEGFDVSGAVCAITPDVTMPRIAAAISEGRTNAMVLDSLCDFRHTEAARTRQWNANSPAEQTEGKSFGQAFVPGLPSQVRE